MSQTSLSAVIAAPEPAPDAQQPSLLGQAPMLLAIVAIFYFLFIRPQAKERKQHEEFLSTLKKGAVVVTDGGILGTVFEVHDDFVLVEVADKVRMRFKKENISGLPAPADAKESK